MARKAMAHRFRFGVSASSEQEYALLARYGVESAEVSYELAGPALLDAGRRARLISLVRDARPAVCSLHAPYRPQRDLSTLDEDRRLAAVDHARDALDLAGQLGAALVVIHPSDDPILPGTRACRIAQAQRSIADLLPAARALRLRLAVETTLPEYLPAGLDEAYGIVEGLDPELVGFCLDTNHSNLTGDLPAMVRSLASRLLNVHLSDNDGRKQQHWLPLKGVIDWKAFLTTLAEVNYEGPLHYELDAHPYGPEQGLREIAENWQQLLALACSEKRQ